MSIFGDDNDNGIFDDDGLDIEEGNKLHTKEQERAAEPRVLAPVKRKVSLVAKFDENSAPLVARADAKSGHLLEEFRRPSRKEVEALQRAGKLVRGGFLEETPALPAQALGEGGGVSVNWKKLGLVFGGITVVGAAGYVGYRVLKARKED